MKCMCYTVMRRGITDCCDKLTNSTNMLLSFSAENFRSFRGEETLSLLASKRFAMTEESPHCCEILGIGEHVLRIASLYGANGAGKSNLVQAVGLVRQLVLSGTQLGRPITFKPFLLDSESSAKPSAFELQFLAEGEVFRYGVCYDADRVHEEWLDVYEGKKERNLFTRSSEEGGTVAVRLGSPSKDSGFTPKIKALAEVGARPNQLFLTEVVNLDDPEAQGPRFQRAVKWFASTLTVIEPHVFFSPLARLIAADETFAEFAGRFLRDASTGIAGLDVKTEEITRSSLVPSQAFEKRFFKDVQRGDSVLSGPDGEEITFDLTGQTVLRRWITAMHDCGRKGRTPLPLAEESDGSRRLLNLLPALYRLTRQGGVFMIDELERSMHPMLARKFIEFFLKAVPHARSQLIFTTHESTLLDLDLMRRDGIWFAEKDAGGATHLYSLADFKVRNDLRIEKGYLEGRFGAIPFLGGIDHLIEEQATAEATS